jgi:hypothetical protein
MNKKNLKGAVGILIMCLAAILMSVNHNVAYENRVPTLIIVGLFAIGGGLLPLSRKQKIEGDELQRCLDYFEVELMVTAFQTRESDLFNNIMVKYFNSMTEYPVAASEMCKAANRLVQSIYEVIRRHEAIQPIPDAAIAMRCAWRFTFLSVKAWAEATFSAMETLANGLTPDYAYVQHLVNEYQLAQHKAKEEEKKFLRKLRVAPGEIEKIFSRTNYATANDNWQPKLNEYDFTQANNVSPKTACPQ